jgi:hypothetical protein
LSTLRSLVGDPAGWMSVVMRNDLKSSVNH